MSNKQLPIRDIVELCEFVLSRLSILGSEKEGTFSKEKLIFPKKIQANGTKMIERVSEQEFRLLFIEGFKKKFDDLHYSIETPTMNKYSFSKSPENIIPDTEHGRSASIDMCIHKWNFYPDYKYNRVLNIEFKHKNASIEKIGKDILKLVHEGVDGAFIFLLDNTDSGSLSKMGSTDGLFSKIFKSFTLFKQHWNDSKENAEKKCIQLIIASLRQKTIIYRNICKKDLNNLAHIFYQNIDCGDITEITRERGWRSVSKKTN